MLDAVVDIGNSRVKMCRCDCRHLVLPVRGVSGHSQEIWEAIVEEWGFREPRRWAVAATHPVRMQEFVDWLKHRGDSVVLLDHSRKVPIKAKVDFPDRVGMDRLLNALAAKVLIPAKTPAIIVDSGSAVTVDLLDEDGNFAGGTIFPGLRLMAQSLNEHTAKLPLIDPGISSTKEPPGKNTDEAMRLGIVHAWAGGIDAIIRSTASRCSIAPRVFLTGGDMTPHLMARLETRHTFRSEVRPTLTLEGIRIAAESLG